MKKISYKTVLYKNSPNFSNKDKTFKYNNGIFQNFQSQTPDIANFPEIIERKINTYQNRNLFINAINIQYKSLNLKPPKNLQLLKDEHTFTIPTAHQPCLFGGPHYFMIKIASAINLANKLKVKYPKYNFVPVFVSGSEDHDFAEMNHTYIFGKKWNWEHTIGGSVGQMNTNNLQKVLENLLELDKNDPILKLIFKTHSSNLTYGSAFIKMVATIFERYGLIVADLNKNSFKSAFIPLIKKELFEGYSSKIVDKTQDAIQKIGFTPQVHVRPINLFYLNDNNRFRIQKAGQLFKINENTALNKKQLIELLEKEPEKFSPNVILRPLFQEFIMPNIAYVGGGGELAYWMELIDLFKAEKVSFPMLIRRSSLLWINKTTAKKLNKLEISLDQLLGNLKELKKDYISNNIENEVNISSEMKLLMEAEAKLSEKIKAIDVNLVPQLGKNFKQLYKSLEKLKGKAFSAQKQTIQIGISQFDNAIEKLFPNGKLQERHDNFLNFYLNNKEIYFDTLVRLCDPLENDFIIIHEE